jgi:hypothetical protein
MQNNVKDNLNDNNNLSESSSESWVNGIILSLN